jgi:glycosyltransferase involved in cell wall biosynthesis
MSKSQKNKRRVLFVGQAYYNTWYLSRALRKLGWKADVLNWDSSVASQGFYHGEDFKFEYNHARLREWEHLWFYFKSLFRYDIFHFSNAHGIVFGYLLHDLIIKWGFPAYSEIKLLKKLGKKIVYSNNGCLDGVSQTSFRTWPTWNQEPVCDSCIWRNNPDVCSDERNLAWGKLRNSFADYQVNNGGNRLDYNDDPRVHDVPEFYCLDPDFWNPDLSIPDKFRLSYPAETAKIYHAVGNYDLRTDTETKHNIKSTHIYIPLIERLKAEGYPIELIFAKDIPGKDVRYYQLQSDIVVDMLTFGLFGANVREAMMLGKPAVCYLRPSWLDSMRREIPEYVDELPVISATPDTVYDVLVDLIRHPAKREEIGQRSREFALKWHSAEAGSKRFDQIYSKLLTQNR